MQKPEIQRADCTLINWGCILVLSLTALFAPYTQTGNNPERVCFNILVTFSLSKGLPHTYILMNSYSECSGILV